MTNDDDRRDAAEAKYQRWIGSLPRDQFDLHMMGCRAYERRGIERAATCCYIYADAVDELHSSAGSFVRRAARAIRVLTEGA